MLGAFSLRLLPVRHRADLRLRRLDEPRATSPRRSPAGSAATCCCSAASACSRSACCSRSAPRRSTPGRPDVYQGAPTAVTAFMAACTKVAAFGALLRLFYVAFGARALGLDADDLDRRGADDGWSAASWRSPRPTSSGCWPTPRSRTPASSWPASSACTPVDGFDGDEISSVQAVLFYLVTYGFMTIGAFAVVTVVRDAGGEATHLSRWAGLGKESPLLAGVFAFFLLAHGRHPADRPASPASGRCSPRRWRAARGRWSWSRCCSARSRRSSTSG